MNVRENKKYQATHRAIMATLMDALKEKTIKEVTVSGLCRTVHINRSTFYEHFQDVYDVLEKIAETVSEEMLKRKPPEGPPTREDLLFLLRHIREHRAFYLLFFHQNLPLNIYERFFPSAQPPTPPHVVLELREIENEVQLAYHLAFFHAGLEAILKTWLERDCAETPEEILAILEQEYAHSPDHIS